MAKGSLALSLTPEEIAKAVAGLKIAGLRSAKVTKADVEASIVYDVPLVGDTEIELSASVNETG